ncbi:hypothetical protein TWF102_007700 [Orbilia oligospora]|uniref:Uncharacterized protein n=1 Tax=Orbilia oligospora TaxID=2813651 RepID=A0A7C8J775_ORBOL|nr:hypothetical protein TWF102_007700 [Orbilia oligospora]KAF3100553.1 hypothetical protein TWF706_006111 [Orbilia oligospora]KAF3101386.1 hypothetical protein TWF103_007959 [Orbilia oligospora]KAF3130534.1 hypothetical protein TWF594_010290 [Orbilia oligospora]
MSFTLKPHKGWAEVHCTPPAQDGLQTLVHQSRELASTPTDRRPSALFLVALVELIAQIFFPHRILWVALIPLPFTAPPLIPLFIPFISIISIFINPIPPT